MANVTDPLIAQLSGSDPQNRLEYITRQKIYDSRYWKEDCFGLTVTNVLEKCVQLECLGTFPHTTALALLLKLLQLHPEHDLIYKAFVEPLTKLTKYARAVGCLYIRLTSRPAEIYQALEPLYADFRKLRVYQNGTGWTLLTMDEWIHQLLAVPKSTAGTTTCLGIILPRLATRRNLQDNGYLPPGPRPSDALAAMETKENDNDEGYDDNGSNISNPVLEYLRFKAEVEACPAAIVAWNKRKRPTASLPNAMEPPARATRLHNNSGTSPSETSQAEARVVGEDRGGNSTLQTTAPSTTTDAITATSKTKSKKEKRNYKNLFKSTSSSSATATAPSTVVANGAVDDTSSEAYWNEQRAKLGLDKLK